jgi:alginate O-acetyltransferase complex protein AlgI
MLFPTVTFALFFAIVFPLSWLTMPHQRVWRLFIVAASYVFYGYWDWHFVFLLVLSTFWNQGFALAIHREQREGMRKALLAVAVAGNLGALGYFKYYDFFLSSAQNMAARTGIPFAPHLASITLPIGISFFTFQALSYVIDIYRRTFEPVSLAKFAVYESFFPHLIAGPIVRASEFIPQLHRRRDPRYIDASRGFSLILFGLFKKVVIANYLATHLVDNVFGTPSLYSSPTVLVGVYAYAVQIWADFSGYTDMAIGLALLLGFQFPQNFDSPYSAVSLQDFWRRWHMTLSRWLRDYLYIPLGGSRGPRWKTYRNLMLTMLLGGLWHGAAWTFVVWGGIHGGGLAFERWRRDRRADLGLPDPPDTLRRRIISRLITFNVVCLAWIFFRADSFSNAWDVIARLFTAWGQPSPAITGSILAFIALGLVVQYVPTTWKDDLVLRFSRLSLGFQGALLGVGLMVTDTLGPAGVAPFIYFRF